MNYQQIVTMFRTSDAVVTGADKFYHGTRKECSAKFDQAMPQTHLLPILSRWDVKNDNMLHDVTVACWEQDSLKNDITQTEAIIQASQVRLMALINHIRDNNPTISISEVQMTDERKTLMATASGYSARFTIITKVSC
jgi:hypothetical protein